MLSLSFKSSVVTRDNGMIVLALFERDDVCSVVLRCSEETGRALVKNVGSALGSSETRP